jgi:hypothetical protein
LRAVDGIRAPSGFGRLWAALAVVGLLGGTAVLVTEGGGSLSPMVHVLYVPVLMAAVFFGTLGGLAAGLAAGALAGPWAEAAGLAGSGQDPADWIVRFIMFAVVGTLVGATRSLLRHRVEQVEELVTTLSSTQAKTLSTFASTIELRDPFTGGHSNRVARNARAVALAMDVEEHMIRGVYWAGLLHDLGKVAVPESILLKPGPLTPDEVLVMRRHSAVGADLLEAVSSDFRPIAEGVRAHHERWDGEGYPRGLAGRAIPVIGRVLAVVDVFEALTCTRPYRGPSRPEEALAYLRQHAGTQFEAPLVDVFEELFWQGEIHIGPDPRDQVPDGMGRPTLGLPEEPIVVRSVLLPDPHYHLGSSGRP